MIRKKDFGSSKNITCMKTECGPMETVYTADRNAWRNYLADHFETASDFDLFFR